MSELFDTIKTSLLGAKTTDIDRDIDQSFKSIERYSISNDRNKYIETIKDLVTKTGGSNSIENTILKGLQTNAQVQTYDQSGRIYRYSEYESIVRKISYCQRALDTLVDHIISPDDITKRTIQIAADENFSDIDESKKAISRCKQIETKIGLENKIRKMVRTTLHKGDCFIEIVCSPKGEKALQILHESTNSEEQLIKEETTSLFYKLSDPIAYDITIPDESDNQKSKTFTGNVVLESSTFSSALLEAGGYSFGGVLGGMGSYSAGSNLKGDRAITSTPFEPNPMSKDQHTASKVNDDSKFKSKYSNQDKDPIVDDDDKFKLKDIFLAMHNPKHIIRLETERFKTCLGYLVFPKIDPLTMINSSSNMTSNFNTVDALCNSIINQLHTHIKNRSDDIKLSPDIKSALLMYLSGVKNGDDLKIRYVPPEFMTHWRLNAELFDPYGESIFECVNFDCRLLTALKTATTIKRLTYATDKRVINVETGLPRDAKNIIETIKEGLSKRKISVDTMGSIDNIPSQIPTFETIYVPMREGKKFVEFDKMEWGMNPSDDIEPLKFLRDNIVANLGVPAPYLGLEENTSNRSLLTSENINFTRTIISYQKELSICLKDMFSKIYKLLFKDFEILDKINITFQEPKISPYEHQMEYVEQIQRLIEALKTMGVPIEYMKKKYLPNLNWDEIEKFSAMESLKQETGEEPADQTMNGGVLAGGGGMY